MRTFVDGKVLCVFVEHIVTVTQCKIVCFSDCCSVMYIQYGGGIELILCPENALTNKLVFANCLGFAVLQWHLIYLIELMSENCVYYFCCKLRCNAHKLLLNGKEKRWLER